MRMYCISVCCVFLSLCLFSATEPSGDLGHPCEEEAFLPEEESPLRWREEIADHFQFPRIQQKIDLDLTGRLDLNGDGWMEQLVQGKSGSGGPSWQLLDSLGEPLISPTCSPTGWQSGVLYLAQKSASGWHDLVATTSLGCNTTIFTLYRYDTESHLYFILREEIHYHDQKTGILLRSSYARDDWDFWDKEFDKILIPETTASHESSKAFVMEEFGVRFSSHEYHFHAQGPERSGYNGGICVNRVDCDLSIAWPEEGCGLSPSGLQRLRKLVISHCFGPEIKKDTIEECEDSFRQQAHDELFSDEGCSIVWEFVASCNLAWPFGTKREEDQWYRRPVIVLKNDGRDYTGGSGCHSYTTGCIVSIPDGMVLTERDYFREDALEDLAALVGKRMVQAYGEPIEDPKVRTDENCWLTLSEAGMTWWLRPYSLFGGVVGVASVTIPWHELEPFAR